MNRSCNYLGQLRVYSLTDLAELLLVVCVTGRSFWGALLLHVGFLAFLESRHRHENFRATVPEELAWVLFMAGWLLFGYSEAGTWYIFFSAIYTFKKHGYWGLVSPFARGAQTLTLLLPFLGLRSSFLWIAFAAMIVRNTIGDGRDVEQDRREGLKTWPVVLGLQRDWVFLHLFAVMGTTWLWWKFSDLPIWLPFVVNLTQIVTYWWTPRKSNKNANLRWGNKILLREGRWGG